MNSKTPNRLEYKIDKVRWCHPDKITPYVNNNKQHPQDQIDKLCIQISRFGFDQIPTVDKDMVLITGHARLLAAKKLGLKSIPYIMRTDLNDNEIMAKRIGDNAVARSGWEEDNLRFELGTLQRAEFDMDGTGLDEKEILKYLQEDDVTTEEGGGGIASEPEKQFIVSVECKDEEEMANLYQELKERGLTCALIT